ncbi:hypothetical protein DK26_19400 [Bosea sp. WAO]|uniref:hypothetical protein n=1 Tax=Bosea sp. WAO TaxID=406341 RepID=UPI000747F9AE|nr:hypothetical protein [Bosea sp. WAO]KUL93915.1 hypothetical protein DK26_19400 [Bosea sp. WAO]
MSAIATLIEHDRVRLLADACFYDDTGILTAIEPKVWAVPRAKAAYSSRGARFAFEAFETACECIEYNGFDEFVAKLDDIFAVFDVLMGDLLGEIVIAGWSDPENVGRVLFRKTYHRDGDDCEPGVIYVMGKRSGFGVDRLDLGDEWSEQRAIAAFQRAREGLEDIRYGAGPEPVLAHAVGGFIGHAIVGPDGVSGSVIHGWLEDEVGRRIKPARLREAA